MTEQQPEYDEGKIQRMTRIADFAHQLDTDIRPVMPQIEPFVANTEELRKAAAAKGLSKRERRVIADALGRSIREGME